jgi:small ligand-binding sensory domain FIST
VGWRDDLVDAWPDDAAMLLLGEPFTFPADYLLQRLNEDRPGTRVIGGMASGGAVPGENQLLLSDQVLVDGAVAVLLHGGLRVRTVVSQGCRPIGHPLVITRAEQNIIYELGGRPAMLQLKDIFDGLPNRDKQLIQRGLHVGLVVNEYQDRFDYGDFWMRNVTGGDMNEGYVTVGEFVRPGQTIQFHVRDEQSAHHDLIQLLRQHQQTEDAAPEGALLFTCNGRGTRLFQRPDHDASAIAETFGDIPLAGFFAQGELGPISNKNFLHGFTASIALFYA